MLLYSEYNKNTMNAPSPEVDVFISNYTIVDPDVYHLWVNGYSGT